MPRTSGAVERLASLLGLAATVVAVAAGTPYTDPTDVKALFNTSKLPIQAVETVSVFSDHADQKMARYFTLLDLSQSPSLSKSADEVWVLARNGQGHDGCRDPHVQLWTDGSAAAPLRPDSRSAVVMSDITVAHNFGAVLAVDGAVLAAGGMYSSPEVFEFARSHGLGGDFSNGGIFLFRAAGRAAALGRDWLAEARALGAVPGSHPGCVERREHFKGLCAFDGRVSLVDHRGLVLLFARANTVFKGGGRYVQVTAAKSLGGPWRPWRLLEIEGYDDAKIAAGNIYCAAMNSNPVDPETILGVFPILMADQATIAVALSCDGVHFSKLKRLLKSDIVGPRPNEKGGNRGVDHPVDGIVQRGDSIYLYVQRDVPGIAAAGPSRIIRLTISRRDLASYTAFWRAKLREQGRCGTMESVWAAEEAGRRRRRGGEL